MKQNQKIVKKMFSYHFNMHLFRAKNIFMPAQQPNANIPLPVH